MVVETCGGGVLSFIRPPLPAPPPPTNQGNRRLGSPAKMELIFYHIARLLKYIEGAFDL